MSIGCWIGKDRTDGTKWTMQVYAWSASEARQVAGLKIASHVTIERVYQKRPSEPESDVEYERRLRG